VILVQHCYPEKLGEVFPNGNSYDDDYRIVLALIFTSICNNSSFLTTVAVYSFLFIPTAILVIKSDGEIKYDKNTGLPVSEDPDWFSEQLII
jgi:hypothetical protein